MFRNFLSGALRNLWRHKVHSLINISSLAVGLAVFALLTTYVVHELTYNRGWDNADGIYRLLIDQSGIPTRRDGITANTDYGLLPQLQAYLPDVIDKQSRSYGAYLSLVHDEQENQQNINFIEPAFVDIFHFDVLAGDLDSIFRNPALIAVHENFANDFLGPSPIGSLVTITGRNGAELNVEVGAVFRTPEHITNGRVLVVLASMHDFFLPLFETEYSSGWQGGVTNWLTLKPGADTAAVDERLLDYVDAEVLQDYDLAAGQQMRDLIQYRLQALTDMYLAPAYFEQGGDPGRIVTFAAIAVLVLLVGCSNSISLSLASVLERQRVIGIHKAMGALRADIMVQSLGETMLLALLAFVPAALLVELLRPVFANLLLIRDMPDFDFSYLLMLLFIAVLTGICSGFYPALVLSSVRPQAVLKVHAASRGKASITLRSLLLGFQFTFAILLLIITLALYLQLIVVRGQPLGFNPANRVIVSPASIQAMPNGNVLHDRLEQMPGVQGVSTSGTLPNMNMIGNPRSLVRNGQQTDEVGGEAISVGHDFFALMEIPLLSGRYFDPVRDSRRSPARGQQGNQTGEAYVERLLVNRAAIEALGFSSPAEAPGQLIYFRVVDQASQTRHIPNEIIGVVENSMYSSLRKRPGPQIYLLDNSFRSALHIAYEATVAQTIQEQIGVVWEDVTGVPPGNFMYVEERIAQGFIREQRESRLLLICAGLALLLSCMGLYGLVAYSIKHQVKEVGIRKVLGATSLSVVALFMWRFSKPVLAANIVAWPVAVYFVWQWLEQFPYQLDKIWLLPLCLGAGLLVLLVALSTVGFTAAKAVRAKPVLALRYE